MDMMVVDIALNFSGLFGERLEIRFHQPDMDGVVILPSGRELVSRIGLLDPCPYQSHDFRSVLPLVIAAFPAVFVIHIPGVFLCRGSRIVIFISG